ncbi:MAG: hypothetical protein ACKOQ4_00160 [Mycobacterium sp.]
MTATARPCLAAVVALLGAGAIAVSPAAPVAEQVSSRAYSLAAASAGPGNVPANLLNMVLSVPAWETQAMNRFAAAMTATGSWQVWGPTNVVGFDELDPPKLRALIDMMVPIKPLSTAIGEQVGWWATANLPMNPGCAAQPGACPDRGAFLATAMKVPMATLHSGYQFPAVTNPFTGEPTSWSGQYVKLDRGAVSSALRNYLTAPPTGVETVSPGEFAAAVGAVGRSVRKAFYPFVQDSEWFNEAQIGAAPLFRRLAPALCPSCNPDKPYDNPWLYENYPPKVRAASAAPAAAKGPDGVLATEAAAPRPAAKTRAARGRAQRTAAGPESADRPAAARRIPAKHR